jgi:hypothetical protein
VSNALQLIQGIENVRRAALSGLKLSVLSALAELVVSEPWLGESDIMVSPLEIAFPAPSVLDGVAVIVLVPWFVPLFSCGKS